jgi:hypothetical protein
VTSPCLMDRDGDQRSPLAPWSSDPLRDAGHMPPRVVGFSNGERGNRSEEKCEAVEGFSAVGDIVEWEEQETEQVALLPLCHI